MICRLAGFILDAGFHRRSCVSCHCVSKQLPASSPCSKRWEATFAGFAGGFLALTLLKFVNPVILDQRVAPPWNLAGALTDPWPVGWGYVLVALLAAAGVAICRLPGPRTASCGAGGNDITSTIPTLASAPKWVLWLPAVWLGWQFVAATQTVDAGLTAIVLKHFVAATACFYVGHFALGRIQRLGPVWVALLAAFVIMLAIGFRQHYGGLEQTRNFVEANEKTGWRDLSPEQRMDLVRQGVLIETSDGYTAQPELLKRLQKSRVFGTFAGYPNALAGAILLLFPALAVSAWRLTRGLPHTLRGVGLGLLSYMSLACLYWSGSKAGWLIGLALGLVAMLRLPLGRTLTYGLVAGVLLTGLAGFAVRYAGYFQKGATSVSARMHYWQAALETARDHPVLGSGPGTFGPMFKLKKQPEAEMARLAHNDYLEQASDSGVIGFLTYFALLVGSVGLLYRNSSIRSDWLPFSVWLGLAGWALQGFVEFSLYIPALAWLAFMFLGWLWSVPRQEIKSTTAQRLGSLRPIG